MDNAPFPIPKSILEKMVIVNTGLGHWQLWFAIIDDPDKCYYVLLEHFDSIELALKRIPECLEDS